ncbi:hypothetical protein [Micromonospora sp. NBRC 107095]|nr:hypothetical protein [Micromonospora sp. NBRC 107095]
MVRIVSRKEFGRGVAAVGSGVWLLAAKQRRRGKSSAPTIE